MDIPVTQLVVELVEKLGDITAITLFRPEVSAPIQQLPRLSEQEHQLIQAALEIRAATGFPFWDCLLQLVATRDCEAPVLLEAAKRHNPQALDCSKLDRNEVSVLRLNDEIYKSKPGQVLALSSRVERTGSKPCHIPMLDFHCKMSPSNQRMVGFIAKELGLSGFIVESGQSYHVYGSNLITTDELTTLLGKSLLYCPILDRAWIGHQLIERACGLRISPGKTYLNGPRVVDRI